MNIRKFFIYVVGAIMMVACSGKGDVAPLIFESYENTAQGAGPEGGSAGLELKIDIPVGKGERQDKVTAGIREIIIQSEVGKELKQPVEGSLKEIADVLLGYFPVGVAKGELESSGYTYHAEAYAGQGYGYMHSSRNLYTEVVGGVPDDNDCKDYQAAL